MNKAVRELPSHVLIPEPMLAFDPQRPDDRHTHPLEGLLAYGPLSRKTVGHVMDPIRVATIAAKDENGRVNGVLAELNQSHRPVERRAYLIDFPGFSQVFGLRVTEADSHCHIRLPDEVDKELSTVSHPHVSLAKRLTDALSVLQTHRDEFDVVLMVLPERWAPGFTGSAEQDEDFDLHDYLKAITASRGIPLQIMRESRAFTYRCRCSVCWRLGIALYCKAGGIPWTLADADPGAAFVGISYAVRSAKDGPRFVTCCSQVFDSDGTGLEFVAYEVKDVKDFEGNNPFLSRADMRRVMARSVALYQRRHGGQLPSRVVIHKSSMFRHEEIDGCYDAWGRVGDIELLQVQQDVPWRAVEISRHRTPSKYPCQRGSMLQLRGREALLWTQGNIAHALGKDFFKEGKGIPSPLALTRFSGHGSFHTTGSEILGLTKMNWNNDGIYDRLPVTMGFASVLARAVKRLSKLEPRPYQVRFLM